MCYSWFSGMSWMWGGSFLVVGLIVLGILGAYVLGTRNGKSK